MNVDFGNEFANRTVGEFERQTGIDVGETLANAIFINEIFPSWRNLFPGRVIMSEKDIGSWRWRRFLP